MQTRARAIGAILLSGMIAMCCGCQGTVSAHTTTAPHATVEAELGRQIFFDPRLSASGTLSCASCHSPAFGYGPPNGRAVQLGGPHGMTAGLRAVPSLRYTLARTPVWSHPRPMSLAEQVVETDGGPVGGFAWDGRFNTLHDQAAFPLLAPNEMAGNKQAIVQAVEAGTYGTAFRQMCGLGPVAGGDGDKAFGCVLRALERFELEDASFHPYSSKYDAYLDGKATLTPAEQRGLALFDDPARGNCDSCHRSTKGADGSHPLFTDYQFEAIGVPRNREIAANRNASFYDLGLCGPLRSDQPAKPYCGMFKTPTLRNVATRGAFFHNGRFHTLRESLEWYVQRDTDPAKWYPHGVGYDDLPTALRGNVDRVTLPLARKRGQPPVWNAAEIDDVIAFLKTLDDADTRVQP